MAATTVNEKCELVSVRQVPVGVVGGIAGGVAFGLLMQAMGMIGMLVGSSSVAVAWLVHLTISAVIGAGFGLVLAPRVTGLAAGLVLGAVVALARRRHKGSAHA